ncbi:MAG: HEPN domain-containing protein [Candidatus Bathyarchaeia archaeon]
MLDEYRRWISSSKEALDSARGDLERGDSNWACFKAQQAAEFVVKALL